MNLIDSIKHQLSLPLPGLSSHSKLAPFAARMQYTIPQDAHEAAVMILLYTKEHDYHIPLITRQSFSIHDKHRGQVALPGGRKDASDENVMMTCIRECAEEIGILSQNIEILGALSPLYIPVSYHHVFPFVACYHGDVHFIPQASEIHSIHEIKISDLHYHHIRIHQKLKTTEGPVMNVPTIQINNLTIWGATAMILEEFSDILINATTK